MRELRKDFFRKIGLNRLFSIMLIFIPISVGFAIFTDNDIALFFTSMLAVIPLAIIMGHATKELVLQTNPTIGGLLSATFGNLIELIIAIIALKEGLIRVVQASIVGSIIGNLLFLTGLSILFGGLRYKHQRFNKESVGVSSTMLIIIVAAISIPSIFIFIYPQSSHITILTDSVALVMALTYMAGLVFSLKTHKELFDASDEMKSTKERPILSKRTAGWVLLLATIIVAMESEFFVRGIDAANHVLGLSETFIGVIVIAIVTNIAEKGSAVIFALKNKLDVSLEIGLSSAIQVALFVVPILVFVSQLLGYGFILRFSVFEVAAILLSVMIVNHLAADGRCNWLEGVQLISVYMILAIVFLFI